MSKESGRYLHGHHESVLRSHTWRTATNSATYLVPYLKPGMKLLDVGCGPGTITADFASLVGPDGNVIGIDSTSGVLTQAQETANQRGIQNIEFQVGDIHALQFPDNTFDVVHAHQVLQHISNPILALSEMRRVTKPGGIVATREADVSSSVAFPETQGVHRLLHDLYVKVARSIGGEPNAGRCLHFWARKAGFEKSQIKSSASVWCFNTPEEISWWGNLWADRIISSSFSNNAIEKGLSTTEELNEISQAWKDWIKEEDAWFTMMHGEIICTV
ncbi:hypothetical protein M422DRAFT_786168 [Sphaerobolus stellatus SS14]|uniref:Methyltransferase domain-containing protein n=1 Tax=Sphaerobolus stellatus (strain SS14) TaxID=990650 RepID=A0A0C9T3K5_SPHS4|nr:hypothetical protein M422DRAFT_786168 [Sphaerobolus stellatus SS14]